MRARTISNETLRRAWFSPAPAFLISSELGIDQKNLQRRWKRLKREGVIPRNGRRDVTKTWRRSFKPRKPVELPMVSEESTRSLVLERISEEFLRRLRQEERLCSI